MKKKISVFLSCVFIFLVAILFTFNNYYASKEVIINEKNSYLNTDNMMSMMYETASGSGEYMVASDNTWPQEGYVFNAQLSGCENGGKLIWDDERKTVTLSTNVSDKCYLYFDKYNVATINSVTVSDSSSESITLTVNATAGQNAIEKYYYSVDDSEYTETNSNVITINGLTSSTEYSINIYAVDSAGQKSNTYTMTASTSDNTALAGLIENLYTSDGENGLYYHDGQGTYGAQEAGDNSYRYSGANPNNYVCFGPGAEGEETCAADNLYRIIGAFDGDKDGNYQIKLIKNTSIGNMAWNSSSNNTWSSASLNTGTLNGTYLSGLGTWASMIAEHDWEVGGMASSNTNTAKQYYATELGNSDGNSITYRAKIGLMYVTDYGYAASGNHWTTELYNYESATDDNWLYLGSTEWTLSRHSSIANRAFHVSDSGNVRNSNYGVTITFAVRPSFYLESSVEISSGTGTSTNPFVLSVN